MGSVRRLPGVMARKKITIRPPGLKPTTKVGTLGPYRGRLGLAWVIAPVIVGALIAHRSTVLFSPGSPTTAQLKRIFSMR